MNPWNIIQKLETDNSRLFKEGVVADHIADADFRQGLQWALNPLVTFSDKFRVNPDEMKKMQDRAHRYCFIANSLSKEVKVLVN